MCMVDYGEPPTISRAAVHRTRKQRQCCECGRTIAVGETYENCFMVYEGHGDTFATCEHCHVGRRWMSRECGGSMYAGGFEEEGLGGELKTHAEEYPTARYGLLRLYVGMRRGWKRFDRAGLLPVPMMPPTVHGDAA